MNDQAIIDKVIDAIGEDFKLDEIEDYFKRVIVLTRLNS